MISVRFIIGNSGEWTGKVVGSELFGMSVADHLFIRTQRYELLETLKVNFLGRTPDEAIEVSVKEVITALYRMWRNGGEHGFTEEDLTKLEVATPQSGDRIDECVRKILNR